MATLSPPTLTALSNPNIFRGLDQLVDRVMQSVSEKRSREYESRGPALAGSPCLQEIKYLAAGQSVAPRASARCL